MFIFNSDLSKSFKNQSNGWKYCEETCVANDDDVYCTCACRNAGRPYRTLAPSPSVLPNLITLAHQNNINYIACSVEWNLICAIPKSHTVFRIQKGRIQALYSKGRRTILQETPFALTNCPKLSR